MSKIKNLTVMGSGVLGGQIAWHSAFKGKSVTVLDISEDALAACRLAHDQYAEIYQQELGASEQDIADTRGRLSFQTDTASAVANADLLIEAVPEVPEIKSAAYRNLAKFLPEYTLIATNSSTLLASDFAQDTGRPEKYCALHFANLIWAMNLAEIMAHATTSEETLTQITEFAIEIGMVPIPVEKEKNGYVMNTWFVALLNAAQTLVTNGISTPEMVDRTYLIANRGAAAGPMGLIDVVGMQTAFNVLQHWGNEDNNEQMLKNADYIQSHFIDKGLMGLPSGEGYYSYPKPAYQDEGFLDVPDISCVPALVAKVMGNAQ
ncbi:MAG: 3-hydroxyacyl-CoA dehydrogenase [Halioglobus sp.]